jgi:serine/threonine protein kinase
MNNSEKRPEIPGYKIEKRLGRGGMADVYLGVQEVLGRQVAIKILNPHMFRNSQLVQRFLNEARTASRLEHPNIVTIHDVGQVGDTCYIVMEYLHESLVDRIKRSPGGRIEPREAFHILKRVTKALDYAHREGFIHRDIKPDNILFRKDNTPVLVDFGIARAVDADSRLTTTGMIIGTPHYMSPEQCRGEKIDGRSDIYSLGIVLYEMLTGDIPYRSDSAAGILVKHIQEPLPALPPELQKYQPLLKQMVAKDKQQRVRSGEALLELLRRDVPQTPLDTIEASRPQQWVFREGGDGEDDDPTTFTPYKASPKKRPLLWLLLVLLLLGGGGAAYYFLKYLPDSQKKPAAAQQEPPAQREIPANDSLTVPADTTAAEKVNTQQDKEYQKLFTLAEVYFKEGKIELAREKLSQARAIRETAEIDALEKQIAAGLEQEEQKKFQRFYSLAEDFFKKGNMAKAKEHIALAQKLKNTPELAALAREIRAREEAARRKAAQERAAKKRDDDAYQQAVSRNKIYSYEKYLEKYPSGRHAEEAQKRLNELKGSTQLEIKIQDDVAFEIASGKNTIIAYEEYLKQFPYGLHAAGARAGLEKLKGDIIRETKIKLEVQQIKFFESGAAAEQVGQRNYSTRFSAETTRYIYTEIKYKNRLYTIAPSTNRVLLQYNGPAGFGSVPLKGVIQSLQEAEDGIYWRGMGWPTPGKWLPGTYTVTVTIEDQKVGQSQFQVD